MTSIITTQQDSVGPSMHGGLYCQSIGRIQGMYYTKVGRSIKKALTVTCRSLLKYADYRWSLEAFYYILKQDLALQQLLSSFHNSESYHSISKRARECTKGIAQLILLVLSGLSTPSIFPSHQS